MHVDRSVPLSIKNYNCRQPRNLYGQGDGAKQNDAREREENMHKGGLHAKDYV